MSLHQIIYTSCLRGINGVNDGQQIYSYDASFKDANNNEVKSLFSYQPPALEPGEIMNEEIALTMPKSFTYRKLSNGMCALALNTYLGRDYMGSAGRFGNYLSHVVIADESDIQNYPCEFYGSNLLRDHMEYEEVNNPNRPDYLPEPVLERGYAVDIDAVIDFLSIGDRMEKFKNMLYAVLSFETERKRVVICDEPENIIMWIAAIEYTLPLKAALSINFSTYDFDPSLSLSQICGVVPKGSRYNLESHRFHFVFDLYQDKCAEFEKDEHYFEFIDTSMSFSYESLQAFHRFISDGYNYYAANDKIYAAYRLYVLLSDGVSSLSENELKTALDFASEYALPEEQLRILENLLNQRAILLEAQIPLFICVTQYVLSKGETLSESVLSDFKSIIVDKIIYEFINDANIEEVFKAFYNKVDSLCKENGFSIAAEIMVENNRAKLFNVIQRDIPTWKIVFIVRSVSNFIKDQHVSFDELLVDAPLGQTYHAIVKAAYSISHQKGLFLVTRILNEFASDCKYLVNMALNIEKMLLDLPEGSQEAASMWKYFGQIMIKSQRHNIGTACNILSKYLRYEQIYMLYSLTMSNSIGVSDSQQIFNEHYKAFVMKDCYYAKQYGNRVFTDYYNKLDADDSNISYYAKVQLFNIVSTEKIDISFAESLVKSIINPIPFEKPTKENSRLIQTAFDYLYNYLGKPVTGKLHLMIIAMALEKCEKVSQLHEAFNNLERLTANSRADMTRITESLAERYFDWILPETVVLCKCTGDIERLYDLFEMSYNVSNLFFDTCTKIYLRQCKDKKDYGMFCAFLGLVFNRGTIQIRETVGKGLCKLNKQRLSELDEAVSNMYHGNKIAISYWCEIKGIAKSANPLMNNISNLFKRRKD